MVDQAKAIQAYIVQQVAKHPTDIVSRAMQHFQVSRTTVLRHIQHLVKARKVLKTGVTKQIRYALAEHTEQQFVVPLHGDFDEFQVFKHKVEPVLKGRVNAQAFNILEYAVTEMLNNAKDHSQGSTVVVEVSVQPTAATITITDDGVGVFATLAAAIKLEDPRELMFELSKGKLTSNTEHHSGEGIFFSSRAVDQFTLSANGYTYTRDNVLQDWSFESSVVRKGTVIQLILNPQTLRVLSEIFVAYQDADSLAFSKTDVVVEMAKQHGERLISRSQAKRVARHLDKFHHVTLDFKNVQTIGQGFVDELFRVYKAQNPALVIDYINANDTVAFMIQRGLPV